MSNSHPSDTPEKGWLSNIAGKAFSVLSVAALCVPLLGIGQLTGIAPGSYYADSYRDVGDAVVQMIEDYKAPHEAVADNPNIVLVGKTFYEKYTKHDTAPVEIDDTHVTGIEGLAGLGLAATFGSAGIIAAGISRGEANNGEAFEPIKYTFNAMGEGLKPLVKVALPLAAIDIIGGDSPSGQAAGAALAGIGLAVASAATIGAVGGASYLTGRSVYDNFIRDDKTGSTLTAHAAIVKSANMPTPV